MEKNIDERWKEAVEKEKIEHASKSDEKVLPEANFSTFISSLAAEALIFLGELPNPMTKKRETNLSQARYIIDTIALLKDKTRGNLTAEEVNTIDNILYELRTKYITKAK